MFLKRYKIVHTYCSSVFHFNNTTDILPCQSKYIYIYIPPSSELLNIPQHILPYCWSTCKLLPTVHCYKQSCRQCPWPLRQRLLSFSCLEVEFLDEKNHALSILTQAKGLKRSALCQRVGGSRSAADAAILILLSRLLIPVVCLNFSDAISPSW